MRGAKIRVLIAAVAVSLLVGAGSAGQASGAIKVARDPESPPMAKFKSVSCKARAGQGNTTGFKTRGRADGWKLRAVIYTKNIKDDEVYEVEYGAQGIADVVLKPPSGPEYSNQNEPQPGGADLLDSAGGVGVAKRKTVFGIGLPVIYDGTGSDTNYITVWGLAKCIY